MRMGVLSVCVYEPCVCSVPAEARRQHQIPWNRNYRVVSFHDTNIFCKSKLSMPEFVCPE